MKAWNSNFVLTYLYAIVQFLSSFTVHSK